MVVCASKPIRSRPATLCTGVVSIASQKVRGKDTGGEYIFPEPGGPIIKT
jgi:hypothetical protein